MNRKRHRPTQAALREIRKIRKLLGLPRWPLPLR